MKTETLNEYIFADIAQKYAQQARKDRQRKMEEEGANDSDVINTPLTMEDLAEGRKILEWYRVESIKLLQE